MGTELLKQDALNFINKVNELELDQMTSAKTIASLQKSLKSLAEINKKNRIALDIATHAIEILTMVSDEAVKEAYKFLEENLNASLERIFDKTTRKIKLKEYTEVISIHSLSLSHTLERHSKKSKVRLADTD